MKHETKTDIIVSGFLPWVEQQPADKAYNYVQPKSCAFTQYLRSLGYRNAACNPIQFFLDQRRIGQLMPDGLDNALSGDAETDWTFGQLAQRLREAA